MATIALPNSKHTWGYILLIIGLVIIFLSGLSVYQVFTGKFQPAQIFNLSAVNITLEPTAELPSSTKIELISQSEINKSMNLFLHLILMSFISSLSFKVSSLGILLLKTS